MQVRVQRNNDKIESYWKVTKFWYDTGKKDYVLRCLKTDRTVKDVYLIQMQTINRPYKKSLVSNCISSILSVRVIIIAKLCKLDKNSIINKISHLNYNVYYLTSSTNQCGQPAFWGGV